MPQAHWFLLSKTPFLARSSHCVSVTKSGILIAYGGELKPRTPVDTGKEQDTTPRGSLHIFDLANSILSQGWRMLTPDSTHLAVAEASEIDKALPVPRVGAATVWHRDALYLWGGRGGEDMSPLDAYQAGVWKATFNLGQGPRQSVRWERIAAKNEGHAPESRSYHNAVAHEDNIYVHAGCPTSGRLSTLHAFDITGGTWKSLSPAPEPARGGTALVSTTLSDGQDVLLRYGGFCGHELPSAAGQVDVYLIADDKWVSVQPAADPVHGSPGPRSVHGFVRFQSPFPSLAAATAVLYHGEGDASSLGHAGAGKFWNDVWVLSKASGEDVVDGWAWRKIETQSVADAADGDVPEGRGWFPSASWVDANGETKVVMFGGLLSSNARTDELWELEIN